MWPDRPSPIKLIKKKYKRILKPKVHELPGAMVEKRHKRSWTMYCILKNPKWKNVITSDESWFYLKNHNGKTKCQYISKSSSRRQCELLTENAHPKRLMVWMGISYDGVTKVQFIESGAKINSNYYQEKILKPFLYKDASKLYPNNDFIFHQDSSPSHPSKSTIEFLWNQKVKFFWLHQWLPNFPDAAPCDYFFWNYLKIKINKRKPNSLKDVKKFLVSKSKKIPLEMIRWALKSWPKRCRQI